jgi:predicted nucleic acid-binding protein
VVRHALDRARAVIASELTVAECGRSFVRAVAAGRLGASDAEARREHLMRTAATWVLLAVDAEVLARAGEPFPAEPIRTLDAIHLATALAARTALPDLAILSLDRRVRTCAVQLGFPVLPA